MGYSCRRSARCVFVPFARSSFVEGIVMRRSLCGLLGGGALLVLTLCAPVRAEDPPALPAAPKGFDARRDGVERGKVEAVEYDSKSVGGKRRMVIYTPPGYSK